jgi:hypothetical protein
LSVVSVVFCHVEVSATGRSLDQSSPTEFGVSDCDRRTSYRMPRPTKVIEPGEITSSIHLTHSHIRHIVIIGLLICKVLWLGDMSIWHYGGIKSANSYRQHCYFKSLPHFPMVGT